MFNQLSNQVENKKSWLIVLTTQHLNDSNSVFQKLQTLKQHNTFARNEKKILQVAADLVQRWRWKPAEMVGR